MSHNKSTIVRFCSAVSSMLLVAVLLTPPPFALGRQMKVQPNQLDLGADFPFYGAVSCGTLKSIQCVDSTLSRGGVDVEDEINKAYAALPNAGCTSFPMTGNCGGIIVVAAGFYSNATTGILFNTLNKSVSLVGAGGFGTIINHTGTSGCAITFNNGVITGAGNVVADLYRKARTAAPQRGFASAAPMAAVRAL
jgi:hypothetical protein